MLGNRLTGDDGVGHDSGDGVAELAKKKLGEVLGTGAELVQRSWRTVLRRGGETTAAQGALRGGARREALGFDAGELVARYGLGAAARVVKRQGPAGLRRGAAG